MRPNVEGGGIAFLSFDVDIVRFVVLGDSRIGSCSMTDGIRLLGFVSCGSMLLRRVLLVSVSVLSIIVAMFAPQSLYCWRIDLGMSPLHMKEAHRRRKTDRAHSKSYFLSL